MAMQAAVGNEPAGWSWRYRLNPKWNLISVALQPRYITIPNRKGWPLIVRIFMLVVVDKPLQAGVPPQKVSPRKHLQRLRHSTQFLQHDDVFLRDMPTRNLIVLLIPAADMVRTAKTPRTTYIIL
jgi:hypothetical protein